MSKLANPPKPRLVDRCHQQDIHIGSDFNKFFDELVKWISTCVTSRTLSRADGMPHRREYDLLNHPVASRSIRALFDFARSRPGKYTIRASYEWGRLGDGTWYVDSVRFWSTALMLPPPPPDPPDKKDTDFENRPDHFPNDVDQGQVMIEGIKNRVAQEARKDASLKENPIDTPSLKDLGETVKDVFKGDIPFVELGKMAVGSWFQAVIHSEAARVSATRGRAYVWFAEGFVNELITLYVSQVPSSSFEKKYFRLGTEEARKLSPLQRYQVKLALMRYSSENASSFGGWGTTKSQDWKYPRDYKNNWNNPGRIAHGLAEQLYRTKYRVD